LDSGATRDESGGSATKWTDPTKNVLDLVLAAVQRLDDLGASVVKRQDDLRDALDKRTEELAKQREQFDDRQERRELHYNTQINNMQQEFERRSAVLLATQETIKSDFGKQIAAILADRTEKSAVLLATQVSAVTERVAAVEKNQYVSGGQQTVRDPGIDIKLAALQESLMKLSSGADRGTGATASQDKSGQFAQWLFMAAIAVGVIVLPFFHSAPAPAPAQAPTMATTAASGIDSRLDRLFERLDKVVPAPQK
jgi:hypothetical protein